MRVASGDVVLFRLIELDLSMAFVCAALHLIVGNLG